MGAVDQSISAGLGGFLTLFLLACALWLLGRSMLKHMRVVEHTTYPGDVESAPVAGTATGAAREVASGHGMVESRPSRPVEQGENHGTEAPHVGPGA